MSYEPKQWKSGDTITAEDLNKMEQGIADASSGGTLIIELDNEASTAEKVVFDKTWQEVYDALKNGTRVIMLIETTLPPGVTNASVKTATNNTSGMAAPYQVYVETNINPVLADTADGYLYEFASDGSIS